MLGQFIDIVQAFAANDLRALIILRMSFDVSASRDIIDIAQVFRCFCLKTVDWFCAWVSLSVLSDDVQCNLSLD